MSDAPSPLVYVILGAAGSGRREVLADLIKDGLDEGERSLVLLSNDEPSDPRDGQLGPVAHWRLEEGRIETTSEAGEGGENATHIFFVTDGRSNPVDQLEAFVPWLALRGGEIGRVICIVNCKLAEQHRELIAWYEACIHFSDAVLLTNRDGVANKWLSDFQNKFKDAFYPCLFEFVKQGKVKNPPLILEPEARRMSHIFDETEWLVDGVDAGDPGESDDDEELGEEGTETEEEVEVVAEVDPYFERRIGGRRVREIPDIAEYLDRKPAV